MAWVKNARKGAFRKAAWKALALGCALLCGCIDTETPPDPDSTESFVFVVPAGSTAKGLTSTLTEQGLIASEWQWKWFARSNGGCLKAGRFSVSRSMGMRELMDTLCGTPLPDEQPFTIVEGSRIRDIDAALAEKGLIKSGAYAKLARSKQVDLPFEVPGDSLEGYLYPETYMIARKATDFSPKELIERQLQAFKERFHDTDSWKGSKRSLHDIVTMASMIEREEPTESQRPIVAGILWKRVDNAWNLGVDATSRYPLEKWNDERTFRRQLKDPKDVYNTRLRPGLPPTPIGSPSISSLMAAVNPKKSEYWYYLHDSKGVFHGGRDNAHHEANRKKYGVY